MPQTFPGAQWETKNPADLGFSEKKLASAESWLLELA